MGEVPGGEAIRCVLEESRPLLTGQPIGSYNSILRAVRDRFAGRDAAGRGQQTFDLRVTIHALTAIECALLDLLGQFLAAGGRAVGRGPAARVVPALGYLFFVGDSSKTGFDYRRAGDSAQGWLRLRDEETLTLEAIVSQAEAAQAHYGFQRFQAQGRRAARRDEMRDRRSAGLTIS